MASIKRSATAEWQGTGKDGKGALTTQSGTLKGTPYGFNSRFGDGARIGANAVVAMEVPAGETVIGIPARPPHEHRIMTGFPAGRTAPAPSPGYGLLDQPCDPVGEEIAILRAEVATLRAEMATLRRQGTGHGTSQGVSQAAGMPAAE